MILPFRALVLPCLLTSAACMTLRTSEYAPGEIPPPDPDRRIVGVTRTSGVLVTFDRGPVDTPTVPAARLDADAIVGTVAGEPVRVDLSDARSVWIEEERYAIGRTYGLLGGVVFGVLMVLAFTAGVGV